MRNKCVSKFSASRIMRKKLCEHADNTMKIGIIKVNFASKKGRCGVCVCFLGFISVWLATNYSKPMALIALRMHFYRAACIFPSSKLQFMLKLVGYSEPSSSAFSSLSLLPLFYRNEASRNCILFIVWNWQTDLKIKLEKKNWRCRNFIRPIWWIHWFDFGTIGKGNTKNKKRFANHCFGLNF